MLPIEEIEEWNRVLARVVGGDGNCYDSTRILAHPELEQLNEAIKRDRERRSQERPLTVDAIVGIAQNNDSDI